MTEKCPIQRFLHLYTFFVSDNSFKDKKDHVFEANWSIYSTRFMLIIIFTMQVPLQIDQVFKIVLNAAPNLCISIQQNAQDNPLCILQFKNLQHQLWRLVQISPDSYRIQSVKNNSVITFHNFQQSEQVRSLNRQDELLQEWVITKLDQYRSSIRIKHLNQPNLSLNVKGGTLEIGRQIVLYQYAQTNNDVWNIIEV